MISNETDALTNYRNVIIKDNGLNYSLYTRVYMDMLYWHRMMINEYDIYGLSSRVCSDIANRILSAPIRITTQDQILNEVIKRELYNRVDFMSILAKHLPHILGIGNGAIVVNRSNIDGKPTMNIISGYNIVPKKYDKSQVYSINWLDLFEMDNQVYVMKVTEDIGYRKVELMTPHEGINGQTLIQNNLGNSLFFELLFGKVIEEHFESGHKKFAWISTGLINARWEDTPFNKGFCFPTECYKAIEDDIINNNIEHSLEMSGKRIFAKPDVLWDSENWFETNKYDIYSANSLNIYNTRPQFKDNLFMALDLKEEKIREYNPEIRENYMRKLALDWQLLGLVLGLGADFYNFSKQTVEATATQVLLEHQPAYLTFKTIIYNISTALKTMLLAFSDYWLEDGLITIEQWKALNADNIGVEFDDGIFVNKAKKLEEALNLRRNGCLSLKTLLERGYNMSEDDAKAEIALIQQEQMIEMQMQAEANALAQKKVQNSEK